MKVDSFLRFGSTFRVLLFAVAVIVLGFYLVKDAAISRIIYMVFGMGLMGFYHEFRQWRINRMSKSDQVSARLSATENKLD